MKPKIELNLDVPWGIGEVKYKIILNALENRRVLKIVEFGSGASTVRLALDFPQAEIISFEEEENYRRQTVELLKRFGATNALVHSRPLKILLLFPRLFYTYSIGKELLPRECDFTLIDGPTESRTLRGREASLYFIFPYLKKGALIALDDYHRDSARAVVRNWLATYGNNLEIILAHEDIILLEKRGHGSPRRFPEFVVLKDNWSVSLALAHRAYSRGKRHFAIIFKKWLGK